MPYTQCVELNWGWGVVVQIPKRSDQYWVQRGLVEGINVLHSYIVVHSLLSYYSTTILVLLSQYLAFVRIIMSFKGIECILRQSKGLNKLPLKRALIRSRNTYSLHTIEPTASHRYEKGQKQLACLQKVTLTERPSEQTQKKATYLRRSCDKLSKISKGSKIQKMSGKSRLSEKEGVIKSCIAQLQEVLEEMHRGADNDVTEIAPPKAHFEEYVRNIRLIKQQSRKVVSKRSKRVSDLTHSQLKNSILFHHNRARTIEDVPPQTRRVQPSKIALLQNKSMININKGYQENVKKKVERNVLEIDCSGIDQINQSSFLSSKENKDLVAQLSTKMLIPKPKKISRRMLVKVLPMSNSKSNIQHSFFKNQSNQLEPKSTKTTIQTSRQDTNKKFTKIKNNKKLMNIFPFDFF